VQVSFIWGKFFYDRMQPALIRQLFGLILLLLSVRMESIALSVVMLIVIILSVIVQSVIMHAIDIVLAKLLQRQVDLKLINVVYYYSS
jgi:hypothetical protein